MLIEHTPTALLHAVRLAVVPASELGTVPGTLALVFWMQLEPSDIDGSCIMLTRRALLEEASRWCRGWFEENEWGIVPALSQVLASIPPQPDEEAAA